MLQPLHTIGEFIDDAIIEYVYEPLSDLAYSRKEKYYESHQYNKAERNHYVMQYLHDKANDCCRGLYEYAEWLDGRGVKTMEVPFTQAAMSGGRWRTQDATWGRCYGVSPSEWMNQNRIPDDAGDIRDVMCMAMCYCVATAFQNYGFAVDVAEGIDGTWNAIISWQ